MTTYYVANAGSDGAAGTSTGAAWQTVAHVNAQTFSPGDSILFNRGDTWREQLTVPSSGSGGSPITFGAYGSGALPILNGSDLVTTWADASGSYDFGPATFEAGTTAEWTSVTDTASKLSVVGGSIIDGTYSMKVVNDVTTAAYASKTFTTFDGQTWTAQFKVNFDASFTLGNNTGQYTQIAEIGNSSWGFIFKVLVINTGGGTGTAFRVIRNYATYTEATTAKTITPGTTYTVTVSCTGIRSGSNNGTYDLSVDGTSIYSATALNLNTANPQYWPDTFKLGRVDANAATATGNLYFDSAYIDRDNATTGVANTWSAAVTTQPNLVLFNGALGTAVASQAACTADKTWYWASNVLYTYGTVNPNTTYPSQIEAAKRNYGISEPKSYVTLSDLDVRNANINNLHLSAYTAAIDHVVVQRVTSSFASHYGLYMDDDGGGYAITNITVQDGTYFRNGYSGIRGGQTSHAMDTVLVSGNTVYGNNWRYDAGGLTKAGINFYGPSVTNVVVESNTVYSNGDLLPNFRNISTKQNTGHGIHLDTVGAGCVVRLNRVYDNNHAGVLVEISMGVQVYRNVISGHTGSVGISMWEWGGSNLKDNVVSHNVCYGNWGGIAVWANSGSAGTITGNLVRNNIATGNTEQLIARFGGENDGTNGSGNVYTYNCFGPEASNFIEWGNAVFKSTYAAWATAYGSATYAVAADPLFTNAGAGYFTLQSGSPCIAAGIYIAGISTANPPDIGAFQTSSVTPSGVAASGAVNVPTVLPSLSVAAPSIAATGAVHAPTVLPSLSIAAPSVAATGAVHAPSTRGDCTVTPAAVAGTGAVNAPSVSANGSASVTPSPASASGAVNAPSVRGDVTVTLSGVAGSATVNVPTVRGDVTIVLAGVAATAAVNAVSAFVGARVPGYVLGTLTIGPMITASLMLDT